jgi:hypothetical protein
VARWDPADLGVHQVIGGGTLPPYVRRPHDEVLSAVLNPAVTATRLVVLRGGSSSGKTRAAWEAVREQVPGWRLVYPLDSGALSDLLEEGIRPRTVLWLGELRQYADADGGPTVLARLARLLDGGKRLLLVTTMWPEQWTAYTDAAHAGPAAAGQPGTAGRLLKPLPQLSGADPASVDPVRGGVIEVPAEFSAAEVAAATATGDPVLAAAVESAAAAGQGGQVTQYLAGVPALLDRYRGTGGDPYGQAVIAAAIDAARLGHAGLMPAAFLQEAAVGYLTDIQRTRDIAEWRDPALEWACAELKGAVRAVVSVAPSSGTGVAGYRPADWLEQYGQRTRKDEVGPASLWDALTIHAASASDLTRLASAGKRRGLYRHAADLWTKAAAAGDPSAATGLIDLLRRVSPGDIPRAARWAAASSSLNEPRAVAGVLDALAEAGADDAVEVLLARDPAAHVGLDHLLGVAELLEALTRAGADDALAALAARAAAQVDLDYPKGVAELLNALWLAEADDAVAVLAARAAAQANLEAPGGIGILLIVLASVGPRASDAAVVLAARAASDIGFGHRPWRVAELLDALAEVGADDAVEVLLARDPAAHVSLDNAEDVADVAELLLALERVGAGDAVAVLAARAAAHASLDSAGGIADLLNALAEVGADDAVEVLLARNPAAQAGLGYSQGVGLLNALAKAGAGDAVAVLAARAASNASLAHPWDVTALLDALAAAGADDAVEVLLARDPAAHVRLHDSASVARLLLALARAGAGDAVAVLAARAGARAELDHPAGRSAVAYLEDALRAVGASDAADVLAARAAALHSRRDKDDEAARSPYGREPGGSPSPPWTWQEPAAHTSHV